MKSNHLVPAIAWVLLSCARVCDATIVVQFGTGTPPIQFTTMTSGYSLDPSNNNIEITNTANGWYRIYSDSPSSEDLGRITFSGSSANNVRLLVSNNATDFNVDQGFSSAACRDWNGMTGGGSHLVKVQAKVGRDLTYDIYANYIARLDVGGNISAHIEHAGEAQGGESNPGIFAVTAGGNLSNTLHAIKGNIFRFFREFRGS